MQATELYKGKRPASPGRRPPGLRISPLLPVGMANRPRTCGREMCGEPGGGQGCLLLPVGMSTQHVLVVEGPCLYKELRRKATPTRPRTMVHSLQGISSSELNSSPGMCIEPKLGIQKCRGKTGRVGSVGPEPTPREGQSNRALPGCGARVVRGTPWRTAPQLGRATRTAQRAPHALPFRSPGCRSPCPHGPGGRGVGDSQR